MSRTQDDRIILCQPDKTKGCSLCCGLFNFRDISSGFLSEFLRGGKAREKKFADFEQYGTPPWIRDEFSHICPFQGFLYTDKPGCLIHPLYSGVDGRNRSLFASKICGEFFCPAHEILSEQEKLFLIEKVSDWHLYSIAVADPESFSFIYNYVRSNYDAAGESGPAGELVMQGLAAHAMNLASYEGAIFCYSIPEYNINKKKFCIAYINESRDRVVSRIVEYISAYSEI